MPRDDKNIELRTALAVGIAVSLVIVVIIGGGLAWAFWSFSNHGATRSSGEWLESPSAAGTITAPPSSVEATAVPDVVSLPLSEATKVLRSAGLKTGATTNVFVEGYATGAVVAQSPASSVRVPVGSAVALTVSKGSLTVGLPSVVGLTLSQARNALSSAGLRVGGVRSVYDAKVKSGLVIALAAEGSRQPQRGDSVSLTISKGRAPVPMPALSGMTPAQARTACSSAGLGLIVVPAGASRGIVYRQSPAAGAGITPGSSANAWVDTPPLASVSARITKLDDTWQNYDKTRGAHIICTSASSDDRGMVSYRWQVEGLDVSVSGTGSSISFVLPGYRRYGSTSVNLTVVDSAGQASTTRRIIKMNWDTGTLQ